MCRKFALGGCHENMPSIHHDVYADLKAVVFGSVGHNFGAPKSRSKKINYIIFINYKF